MINLLAAVCKNMRSSMVQRLLRVRVQARCPSLRCHHTVVWDYSFDALDSIQLGREVFVGPFVEILVYRQTKHSQTEGKLVIGDRVMIGTGVNIRAAGGVITIGNNAAIAQHTVLVAANHQVVANRNFIHTPWDESRTGISVGNNVWIGANCAILPGVTIGNNVVIGAGSVVNRSIPENEVWAGVPARKLRDVG